ncbi:Ig domain-containing protein [Candidatus Korobacter versatilis]|uniref:Ig domain-containing protein n=1 Tax=Candidatus Korobacter versatilis TaxID=658062 RepID=UPI001650D217|nr:Ig domain-containing protein [Candidatus Koribacter versatilis]
MSLCLAVLCGCGGGGSSSTTPPPQTPPSNLTYAQSSLTATVGVAITALTPSVTGTVTSYAVSPALPSGFALSASTGVISGTPTAATPQTTYTIAASNSAGSANTTIQITVNAPLAPPSNLVYPQTSIVANVGLAIATDTPTVTGTVTSYSVSPSLPAGLALNATTGAISGTPTAETVKATYTVTATNAAGSTTATVQITVNPAVVPPGKITYPQSSVSGEVGQPIATNIPAVSGTPPSFSVSPALPAGVFLDATSGGIYGTPTAEIAKANYTVTATNPSGSATATLSIGVDPALPTLFELGTTQAITTLLSSGTRVIAQDASGHWTLVDYAGGTEVADGDQLPPTGISFGGPWPVDLRGSTLAIGVNNGIEIRSASDGSLLALVASPFINPVNGTTADNWFKLATDGSYLCAGTRTNLWVWSTSGAVLLARDGDYSAAQVFAAPGELRIALGPVGTGLIETVATADGTSTLGTAFSGNFAGWFVDGERYITTLSTNAWVYSKASVEESFLALPSVEKIGGMGEWLWTYQASTPGYPVNLYSLSSSVPVATYSNGVLAKLVASGNTLGLSPYGTPSVKVIDLSTSTPTSTDVALPAAYVNAYTAFSPTQWLVGNVHGTVVDGASLASTPRFLANGAVLSMSGSLSSVAVADANGFIYQFDPTSATPLQTIPFTSSQVGFSADGSVLAAAASRVDSQYQPDRTLNIYALPGTALINTWPYMYPGGTDFLGFSLAASGNNVGQVTGTFDGSVWHYTRQVTAVTGGTVLWSDTLSKAAIPQLSPGGTLIAAPSDTSHGASVTTIYNNGVAVTAVPGFPIVWLDDSHLLVQNGSSVGATIYSPTGVALATPLLPAFTMPVQPLSSGLVYSSDYNQILSTSTGEATWTSGYPYGGFGAAANGYVVFVSGARLVALSQ